MQVKHSSELKSVPTLGGPRAGLAAMWQLVESGYEVDICEKPPQVGGMCRRWEWGDISVDTERHIFQSLIISSYHFQSRLEERQGLENMLP
jgi:phytoene dehydrogenase-like protein